MPITHELHAAPFHIDRPWYAIEDQAPPEVFGPVVVLCSDHQERDAIRDHNTLHLAERLPAGVSITHWRIP